MRLLRALLNGGQHGQFGQKGHQRPQDHEATSQGKQTLKSVFSTSLPQNGLSAVQLRQFGKPVEEFFPRGQHEIPFQHQKRKGEHQHPNGLVVPIGVLLPALQKKPYQQRSGYLKEPHPKHGAKGFLRLGKIVVQICRLGHAEEKQQISKKVGKQIGYSHNGIPQKEPSRQKQAKAHGSFHSLPSSLVIARHPT